MVIQNAQKVNLALISLLLTVTVVIILLATYKILKPRDQYEINQFFLRFSFKNSNEKIDSPSYFEYIKGNKDLGYKDITALETQFLSDFGQLPVKPEIEKLLNNESKEIIEILFIFEYSGKYSEYEEFNKKLNNYLENNNPSPLIQKFLAYKSAKENIIKEGQWGKPDYKEY